MAKLVHLCTDCRHAKAQHSPRDAAFKPCRCCRQEATACTFDAEPTILPTFDYITRKPEPLYEPGSRRNAGSAAHGEKLCDCDACHAVYARETA